MPPSRPPKPAPVPTKPRLTLSKSHKSTLITLTHQQKVKVKIINWKRCSVASLLIVAYISIGYLMIYFIIGILYYKSLLESPEALFLSYQCFGAALFMYFFGTAAAVNAITYVWHPLKFGLGIATIILAVIFNTVAANFGTRYAEDSTVDRLLVLCHEYATNGTNSISIETIKAYENKWGYVTFDEICSELESVIAGAQFMRGILPIISVVCSIISVYSAIKAIYIVPKESKEGKIDAAWLEPYETYDFYVGRNIPKIPGYDEVYEGVVVEAIGEYSPDSDDSDEAGEPRQRRKSHQRRKMKKKQQVKSFHELYSKSKH